MSEATTQPPPTRVSSPLVAVIAAVAVNERQWAYQNFDDLAPAASFLSGKMLFQLVWVAFHGTPTPKEISQLVADADNYFADAVFTLPLKLSEHILTDIMSRTTVHLDSVPPDVVTQITVVLNAYLASVLGLSLDDLGQLEARTLAAAYQHGAAFTPWN